MMSNLDKVTPNMYVVSTQAGWRKLLKQLKCYSEDWYCYECEHIGKDDTTQYPLHYPCIITFDDKTFEHGHYRFYIKYINKELRDMLIS